MYWMGSYGLCPGDSGYRGAKASQCPASGKGGCKRHSEWYGFIDLPGRPGGPRKGKERLDCRRGGGEGGCKMLQHQKTE